MSNIRLSAGSTETQPKQKAAKAAPSSRVYTPLAKTSLGNTDLYNLYGIVIDASSPHPKKNFFRQLLKIVDPSMHYKQPRDTSDPNNGCVSVTFFAHQQEALPTFMRVGDIIRIHRANIGTYKNYKTFSVNLAFGSSWVIFSGFEDSNPPKSANLHSRANGEESKASAINDFYNSAGRKTVTGGYEAGGDGESVRRVTPYKASSKEYSLSAVDFDIVTRYRTWLAEYFESEFNYEATLFMNLSKVREFIINEANGGGAANQKGSMPAPQFNYPREYDLVVRVDEIAMIKQDLAKRVMTGGRLPQSSRRCGDKEITEESKSIKISDTAAM